jgi:hypothetical protein
VIELDSNGIAIEAAPPELLARRAGEQLARFRRGEPSEDCFCLELFRRAVVERDEDCWRELHSILHEQVLSWCRVIGPGGVADPAELVCIAWEKFWLHFTPAKLAAAKGIDGVLCYLKMCARSAAMDAVQWRTRLQSLDAAPIERSDGRPTPAEAEADRDARTRFWAIVNASLRDERERVLAHLNYEVGLRPCEILAQRPDFFHSSAEVYQVTRNIVDRLRRSRELQAWVGQEQA